MLIFKVLNYVIPLMVVLLIVVMMFRSHKDGQVEKEILKDPAYTDAKLLDIVPGTPGAGGIDSVKFTYEYVDANGHSFKKENVLTAIKTINLYDFKIGMNLPIIYSKINPEKSMLKMKNALEG